MRLQAEAALLGDLISERTIRTHFYAGLDVPTATFAQSLLPHGPVMQTFHEAVAHASQVDQSIALLRPAPNTNVNTRALALPSRSNIQRSRGILSIPEAPPEDETMNEASSSLDFDTGVFAITDQSSRTIKQFYCFVCWKQGHFALDCPLISERDRKQIAERKTAVLALMRDRPGWRDRTGRMYPNIPYQGGVNPSTSNAENPEQSKNLAAGGLKVLINNSCGTKPPDHEILVDVFDDGTNVSTKEVVNVMSCAISDATSDNSVPENPMRLIEGILKNKISNDMERTEVHEEDFVMPILSSSIYHVSILIGGKHDNLMQPIDAAFDTCASSYIIRQDVLPSGAIVRPCEIKPRLVDANGLAIMFEGVASVRLQVGGLSMRTEFLVAKQLSVPLSLGTSFIDENVEAIFLRERRIVLKDMSEVSIGQKTADISPVKLEKDYYVPASSEFVVAVTSKRTGISRIRQSPMRSRKIVAANGITELPTSGTFLIQLANFSDKEIFLRKGSVVAIATEVQSVILVESNETDTNAVTENWTDEVDMDSDLSPEQRESAMKILESHKNLWSGNRFGEIVGVEHRIITQGGPTRQQPYRAGPRARESERIEVERMLAMDVIEPSISEWAAPVVLVPKPDGSLRFCIDYRKFNSITERDVYPLPRMDDCLDSLGEEQVFSTLYANAGYWQVKVAEKDLDKTSFICHAGTYQFKRMPFGLVNAPSTFQRSMDVIISSVKWKFCLVYFDDIIIYSPTFEKHAEDLDFVLGLLEGAGVTLRLRKCHLFQKKIKYLGHIALPGKLQIDQNKTLSVRQATVPRTRTEMRSFLGLCNVYRRFIPHFAQISSPLTSYLKGNVTDPFELDARALNSFEQLKMKVCSSPVLALPTLTGELVLDTDAADEQIGCCLQQRGKDGHLHPLGYWSRLLNSPELNYSATKRGPVCCLGYQTFTTLLGGFSIYLRTDHAALTWIFSVD
jgi:Reverse transcriptase (RNA-dependent DNA polymerase)/RNase H-like domain found in reverse transcriptase